MKSFKLVEHLAEAACVAAHPNGKIYATGGLDDRVLIWDYSTGSRKKVIRGFGGMVLSLSFHEDGSLFVGGNGSILRVDVETGETLSKLVGFKGFVYSLSVFSDFLVSGGQDGRVRCWGLDGEIIWERQIDIGSVHGLEKLPDSSLLVVGERPNFHVLDIRGNLISEIPAHRDSISSLAVHKGGFLIATGSDDGSVSIWRNGDWTLLKHFNCEAPITSLSFSPKHSLLAVGRKYENAILLDWNKRKKYLSNISKSEGVTSFEWSLNGAALFGTLANGTVLGWGKKPKANKAVKKVKKIKTKKIELLAEKIDKEEMKGFAGQLKDNKFFKNRYFQIFMAITILLVFSLLLKDSDMPPKSKIREARSYIEEESWVRASSLLIELNQEWPESADVSNLLASYEQDAFVSLKRKIQSLFDSGNFKDSILELKKIPLKPDLPWVSSLLKKSYEMRLSEIKELTKIDIYIDPYLDYDDDFLSEVSSIVNGLKVKKPDWLFDAEELFEFSEKIPFGSSFSDSLNYFLKNSKPEETRYFAEKTFSSMYLKQEDRTLIFSHLYEISKGDNLPIYSFDLKEQVYSLSQIDCRLGEECIYPDGFALLLGFKEDVRVFGAKESPINLSSFHMNNNKSPVKKVNWSDHSFWASSEGAWKNGEKIVSSKRYFDTFDLANGGFGVFHERETRSLQVLMNYGSTKFVWDGLESRQIKLSINNNEHIAIGYNFGPNNSLVSLYKVMRGETMGLSAVGNLTINQPIIDVLISDFGTIFAFDQNGQIWMGNASEDFPKAKKMLSDPKSIKLGSVAMSDHGGFAFATEFTDEIFIFNSAGVQLSKINWDPSFGKIWTLDFFDYSGVEMLVVASEKNLVFLNMKEKNE